MKKSHLVFAAALLAGLTATSNALAQVNPHCTVGTTYSGDSNCNARNFLLANESGVSRENRYPFYIHHSTTFRGDCHSRHFYRVTQDTVQQSRRFVGSNTETWTKHCVKTRVVRVD